MNLAILAMWITLGGAALTLGLLVAWLASGRRNTTLRVLAGICTIITMLAFAYGRFFA